MAEPVPAEVAPQWRAEQPLILPGTPPPPSAVMRRIRLALVGLALVAVGLIVLLSWIRPVQRAEILPLWVADYQASTLPLIPQAANDREALLHGNYFDPLSGRESAATRSQLVLALAALADRPADRPLVVYLCARARLDQQGRVQLFPADADPDHPETWLPLTDVLERLRACPARNKLLVLDILYPLTEPSLGLLGDDVAGGIERDLGALDDGDRLVLCACSPGESALTSATLGRTVFGYYLEQGLRGWADGYNTDGERDGRISVRELAEFVRRRVARWAWRNRRVRQVPRLLGAADDFVLVTLPRHQASASLSLPAAADYPAWLAEAWQERERWWTEARYRRSARTFRQLEAAVLQAEQAWQGGRPAEQVREAWQIRLNDLKARFDQSQPPAGPEPRSLAQAAAQGRQPNQAVTDALKELLAHPPSTEPPARRVADFLTRFKDATAFDLAAAAFETAATDPDLTPDKLRLLNLLLQNKEPQPPYVETLFLRRLEVLAQPGAAWPRETIHRALQVVRQGEEAAAQLAFFPRLRPWLEYAAQRRHDGEVILLSPGYAPPNEADRLLQQAGDAYQVVLASQSTLQNVQRCLDEALVLLPDYISYLETSPQNESAWLTAVRSAEELYGALAAGAGATSSNPGDGGAELRRSMQTLALQADLLQEHLDDLLAPFRTDNLAALRALARQADAGPALLVQIEGLLATPFLKPADRQALWQEGRDLARRLNEATLRLDEENDHGQGITLPAQDAAEQRQAQEMVQQNRALERARWSSTLLRLGGLTGTSAEQALAGDRAPPSSEMLRRLAHALRQSWTDQLPKRLLEDRDLLVRDRLGRIVPPLLPMPLLDDPRTNPQTVRRAEETVALWTWLAGRYRYEARDSGERAFFAPAALAYQDRAGPLAEETYLTLTGSPEPVLLTADGPAASYALNVSRVGPATATLEVHTLRPEGWFRIQSEADAVAVSPSAWQRRFRLELESGPDRLAAPPRGFLIEAQLGDRTYHHRVTVVLPGATEQVGIFLAATPAEPQPLTALRLRPVKGQTYYLFVRNTTDQARNIVVQLKAGEETMEAKLALKARETRRVAFASTVPIAPAAGSPSDLPELTGPLFVQVHDSDNANAVLGQQQFDIRLTTPADYVQVNELRYFPASSRKEGKDLLQVRLQAMQPLSGPPCVAELVLPSGQVPGLKGDVLGTFRGELPADGQELRLFAEDLHFVQGTDQEGLVALTVDGCPRTFLYRVLFARRGGFAIGQRETRPALHLSTAANAPASPRQVVAVKIDNAPAGASLEVSLGQFQDAVFQPQVTQRFASVRQQRIGFSAHGPGGALLFDAFEKDWSPVFDTSKVAGQRVLRARLLDERGFEIRSAFQALLIDNTPPENVQFLEPPAQARRGTVLTLQASGVDPESGIAQVLFFVGKPVDNKVPPQTVTVAAQPLDRTRTVWTAPLPLPADKLGPTDISVQFINGAGMSTFATVAVTLLETDPVRLGKIRGQVVEGPRPQAGLVVILRDEKGTEKGRATTDGRGDFLFERVPAGAYRLATFKEASQRKAEAPVTVSPDGVAVVTLELSI